MKVAVTGARSNRAEWAEVQNIPLEQLPPLTPEQERTADELRIPREMYQRSALANRRVAEKQLRETEWFAKLLQKELSERAPQAKINSVVFDTWQGEFQIEIAVNGKSLPLHISEAIVEQLFALGSGDAERQLTQMLEYTLHRFGVL
ncbi:MAG: hypothetical protein ACRD2G_20065 [Terriglobia bacterium]